MSKIRYLTGRNLFGINCSLSPDSKSLNCEVLFLRGNYSSQEKIYNVASNIVYCVQISPGLPSPLFNIGMQILSIEARYG